MAVPSSPTADLFDSSIRVRIAIAVLLATVVAAALGALWPVALVAGVAVTWRAAAASQQRLRDRHAEAERRADGLGAVLATVIGTDRRAIVVRDALGDVVDANPAAVELLGGWPEHRAIAARTTHAGAPTSPPDYGRLRDVHPTSDACAEVVQMARDYGAPVEHVVLRPVAPVSSWLSISAYPVDTDRGRLVVTVLEDVSNEIRAISEVEEASEVDELTGVGNRRNLERSIRALETTTGSVGVILVDFDAFKSLNDHHGPLVGDEVLREAGSRLRILGRPGDVVARLGGDEFVVLIPGASSDAIEGLVHRVEGVLTAPFVTTAGMVTLGCSVGSAIGDAAAVRRHINHADNQMYERKRAGVGRTNMVSSSPAKSTKTDPSFGADLLARTDPSRSELTF